MGKFSQLGVVLTCRRLVAGKEEIDYKLLILVGRAGRPVTNGLRGIGKSPRIQREPLISRLQNSGDIPNKGADLIWNCSRAFTEI
jgi:hypothetical protein